MAICVFDGGNTKYHETTTHLSEFNDTLCRFIKIINVSHFSKLVKYYTAVHACLLSFVIYIDVYIYALYFYAVSLGE